MTIQYDHTGIKKNFTEKVSGDISKITQPYTIAQANTGKLIENVILQALSKSKDSTPPNLALIF